jgi:hypothetical protein
MNSKTGRDAQPQRETDIRMWKICVLETGTHFLSLAYVKYNKNIKTDVLELQKTDICDKF